MAVSVLSAAGVVTTQKAAAQPTETPIVVNYNPGATYSYAPKQFNNKHTVFAPDSPTNPKHLEAATGGAVFASMSTKGTQAADNYAQVGTYWKLNLPSGASWATVQNMPCKVTVKVNYHIEAKGNGGVYAEASWGPISIGGYSASDTVRSNGPVHAKSVVTTTTWEGKVGDLFYSTSEGQYGIAGACVNTGQSFQPGGQASASLVCSSIVLEFPAI